MKKFFSLVLALVMALSLTTVAWGAAATNDPTASESTVTLSDNLILDDGWLDVGTGEVVTLNLNGKTLSREDGAGNLVIYVHDGGKLTVNGPGTIDATNLTDGMAIYSAGNGSSANVITLNNVTVKSSYFGVYHNGNNYGADVTINNSTVIDASAAGAGVFLSGQATWANKNALTITNSNISGATAVEVKQSDATVTNSTLTSTYTGTASLSSNGNGMCAVGYALALTNNATDATAGTVTVNSGTFKGAVGIKDSATTNEVGNATGATIAVKGGTFTDDVSDYVADGYRLVNGTVASVPANTNGVVGGYEGQLTVKGAPRQAITNFTKTAAVTPDDVNEDGLYNMPGDVIGSIEYYTFNLGGGVAQNYYQVDSVNDADLIVYVGDSLVPYMYLANEPAGGFQYWYGVASFNDFGSACGQFKYADYDATESYYVYAGQVFVLDDDGAVNLKVGTKFVQANNITASGKWVAHTPVYAQNDKGVVTGISCAKCSDVGVIVSNFAALPTAMKAPGMNFPVPGSTSKYYYWVDTAVVDPSTPSTDKVTSAETFDAGIAMYVGMSVMAAAGSAVVLKKKD